jgi:tetratricopeptide (TPR) repeat protein
MPEIIKEISEQLEIDDPAVIAQAVAQIHQLLQSNPQRGGSIIRPNWMKRLMELGRYDDVLDLSLSGILQSPANTTVVEQLQTERVQAFLATDRAPEALVGAKQLFNIATLKGTSDAIRTVCQCLDAVHPEDRDVLKRYRKEQIDGATPDAALAPAGPSSLSDVRIDPSPYQPAIRQITAEDYAALTGKGNLLLLAGDPKNAWEAFERAYTLAPVKELAAASENLARCMKAQDGTIGRANAWILSIRPKAQAASLGYTGAELAAKPSGDKE